MVDKKFKKWTGAVMIPIDKLTLTDWNVNVLGDREFAELCREIETGGFDEPCQVVPLKEQDGNYLVLGGEHRVKVMRLNGEKEVPCVIKEHLTGADERTLTLWSVKRNNIRGKIDQQKYAELEKKLSERWGIAAEAARREMLIREDVNKALKDRFKQEANASHDDSDLLLSTDDISESDEFQKRSGKDSKSDIKSKFADRRALLQTLKAVEQEVLLESDDTVEHGYLFFGQNGGLHLVVNESEDLHNLVASMVEACKKNSNKVEEFLIKAISKELPNWSIE